MREALDGGPGYGQAVLYVQRTAGQFSTLTGSSASPRASACHLYTAQGFTSTLNFVGHVYSLATRYNRKQQRALPRRKEKKKKDIIIQRLNATASREQARIPPPRIGRTLERPPTTRANSCREAKRGAVEGRPRCWENLGAQGQGFYYCL